MKLQISFYKPGNNVPELVSMFKVNAAYELVCIDEDEVYKDLLNLGVDIEGRAASDILSRPTMFVTEVPGSISLQMKFDLIPTTEDVQECRMRQIIRRLKNELLSHEPARFPADEPS